ncbi:DNA-processing protein DprA [Alcaligenes faecalis]|uniref:DNA-processing protein DprA n=1 Tax=Alcaligenes faecalis TaxID=511 RepID=UPI00208E68DF|nr:DNA-processing protein DprA [Alcaligenes faecalis]USP48203.1 DNA-processing protein DprA [Alcaligenes faecalis]
MPHYFSSGETSDEISEELRAWLRLSLEPELAPAQSRQLLAACGLPPQIYQSSVQTLSRHIPTELAVQLSQEPLDELKAQIEQAVEWLKQPNHHVVTLADPTYPASLLDLHDAPLLLYANGDLGVLQRKGLAIVGARNATQSGQETATDFAATLASRGWCIISGLASGIDQAAHKGALKAGPPSAGTIAVMGTGLDLVYPAAHRDLAHQISAHGLLLSEFPLGTRAMPHHFPRRNRIVAALAKGVLVVEAAKQSGSLITARLAGELGREVFAIPGSIHSPLARGCHALIRQGAKLVESAQDILDELGNEQGDFNLDAAPQSGPKPNPYEALPEELRPILERIDFAPLSPEQLMRRTGLLATELPAVLAELELAGCIEPLADGRFQRIKP